MCLDDDLRMCVRAGCGDGIVEVKKSGTPQRKITLHKDLQSMPSSFSSFIYIPEVTLQSLLICLLIKNASGDSLCQSMSQSIGGMQSQCTQQIQKC